MLDLSPTKVLVVLIVALIVLGPDKLPVVARQLGAGWGSLRRLRAKLESEVRESFPDLPSTDKVAQVVRSPLAFLDQLADAHEREQAASGDSLPADNESPPGGADTAHAPADAAPAGAGSNGHVGNGVGPIAAAPKPPAWRGPWDVAPDDAGAGAFDPSLN